MYYFCGMAYKLSTTSRGRLNGVNSTLIAIIEAAITDSPYDFGIPPDGGLRTTERQKELYAQGRTKAGNIVTQTDGVKKKSVHQSGNAFDIYAFVDGKASWEAKYYEPIARHIQKVALEQFGVKLVWGGDWSHFRDLPHLQIG
jgi:peptidoglycan L-alanyl-D-glutamate endopeptidase CwlK